MAGSPSAAPLRPAQLLAGQAALGNQAVQRLLHLQREDSHGQGCTCAGCARSDAVEVAQREDSHGHGCTCAGCAR